jgi:hypothetical protein
MAALAAGLMAAWQSCSNFRHLREDAALAMIAMRMINTLQNQLYSPETTDYVFAPE